MRPSPAQQSHSPTFDDLIAPVTPDEFFGSFYERDVLHLSERGSDSYPRTLRGIDPFQIVRESCAQWGEVSLAGGAAQSECRYVADAPSDESVRAAYADGYTIVINDMQVRNPAAGVLCRLLEKTFFCRANVNLYLTGPDLTGLDTHYDDDDVFIIQLSGAKYWRTYPTNDRLPLGRNDYQDDADWGPSERHILRAGDLLYLPRGTPHDARSGPEPSLHLTISINVVRWAEIASELIYALAQRDSSLRRAVPLELLQGIVAPPLSTIPHGLERLVHDNRLWPAALQKIQTRILNGAPRLFPRESDDSSRITYEDILRIADDQIWATTPGDDEEVIQAIGSTFAFSGEMRAVVEVLRRQSTISANDLPPRISSNKRLGIIRDLASAGFLMRENSPAAV